MSENIKQSQNYARIYNIVMACIYLLVFCCLAPAFLLDPEAEIFVSLILIGCIGSILMIFIVFHGYLAYGVANRTKFMYYGNIVSFALGLSSILTLIPGILLIVKWVDQEVKDYYISDSN